MTPTADPRRLRDLDRRERRRLVLRTGARTILIVAVLVAAYYLVPIERGSTVGTVMTVVIGIGITVISVVWQIAAVDRSSYPQLRAVEAVATTAALVAVIFASTYLNMSRHDPTAFTEQFDRTGALYFTMTTLTTLGYGDIAARSNPARIAVMLQMVVNVVVVGAAVKLLAGTARARLGGMEPGRPGDQD